MEREAVITKTKRDTQKQRQNISVRTVAVDNGLTLMGHEPELTCLWLVLLYVADAATFSSIGHTTPTTLAEQATTVFSLESQIGHSIVQQVGNSSCIATWF